MTEAGEMAGFSGQWPETAEPFAGYRQSTTACCPRQTIPDSCGCLEGCGCLCADCDCGTDCDCGDDEPWSSGPSLVELDAYGDFAPERTGPSGTDTMAGPGMQISVMSGQEAGLQRLRQEARTAGEAATEYAQLDGNGVFLVWDSGPDAEGRFPLAERIRIARSYGGLIFRRRVIVAEDWEEVAE